ncbi:Eco47II family restriction endonuclease [Priestia megaterium]|uniref:Eco47II family restriction endonuclease n=1 Tax=Priestia megaterium TaxID=1404 RepID=UPI00234F194E|nr:Eco47II family restriction endonuclease [Priestia megaterium]MDC7783199.1 Eco47II family restriction endonuclease [Priestia megaterium]
MNKQTDIALQSLSFISTEYILSCIKDLHIAYQKAKSEMTLAKFQSNKVDGLKLTLDALFNGMNEEEVINAEVQRQSDKSINNAIGTFHEQLMGGLPGIKNYTVGHGFDIKSNDNTIIGEIKNKHNTLNSSSAKATFEKLEGFANQYPNATAYLILIIAKKSTDKVWTPGGKYHPRVRIISADQFYAKVTGIEDAFFQLCNFIPKAVQFYLQNLEQVHHSQESTLFKQLSEQTDDSSSDFWQRLIYETFETYKGFQRY